MNIGLYQGASALAAAERLQAVTAGNIASASVPGFRKTEASFDSVLAQATKVGGQTERGVMPQITERISMKTGELRSTGNETDFALDGPGFFQIQRADGSTGYTRDGEFHVSADRTLVNKANRPVLGDGGPITLRPEGGSISVNGDGMVVQGATPIAKLAVSDFSDSKQLERAEEGLFKPAPGAAPQPVEKPRVLTGTLEGSNVQPLQEMINLVALSRGYETSQRVILTHDEAADKAIQMLGNPNA